MDLSERLTEKYEAVIGLEVHVQLSTVSKAFSADSASFGNQPNSNISVVSLGLPGALPQTNEAMVKNAVKLGLALNCEINQHHFFDRKNYFYADLPKGYQITQDNQPICQKGYIIVKLGKSERKVALNRIHIEEDAGKSIHDLHETYSYIDLNRAGVPLLEVVSEPVIKSAEEAAAYFSELRKIVRYLEICDGNLEEGSMRCDANISVRLKGETKLGKRCEVKNLNSIKNLQRAIEYEIKRQINLLEKGEEIEQNTLNFDALTGITTPLRSKEMANDYRYFPEPDLQPMYISDDYILEIKKQMPLLPNELEELFINEFSLTEYDAMILTAEKNTALYFMELAKHTKNYKACANWILGPIKSYLNVTGKSITDLNIAASKIALIINMVDDGAINYSQAKEHVFDALIKDKDLDIYEFAKYHDILIKTDNGELELCIDSVLSIFADKVAQYHQGKKGLLGLFMGEIMKKTKGKIDPKTANKILLEKIDNLKS
ncbi:Asp-tRNA(Asn)/Glu-tRNA(Gln) amidotransferase subunit GatB [Pseudopedobacter beijingensis]|uniref:Aspartyl/glutamyl-tRNA(Asn/Gln) amidotransferase subunit B n=1 Tax=Pseudopedobacter beijingensis TaxID=1207056 RepID=A0ABW4IH32_9SPHI